MMKYETWNMFRNKARGVKRGETLLNLMYEIPPEFEAEIVIISPCWKPYKVFTSEKYEIYPLAEHNNFSSYRLKLENDVVINWIYCSPGPTNVFDVCMTLKEIDKCMPIFVGSAGTLDKELEIGEVVLCDGASYLKNFFEILNINAMKIDAAYEKIEISKPNIPLSIWEEQKKVKVFSTPSIVCEYTCVEILQEKGCSCIEMETAYFLKICRLLNLRGTALLVVSDSVLEDNKRLLARDFETRRRYQYGREYVLPKLITNICNGLQTNSEFCTD